MNRVSGSLNGADVLLPLPLPLVLILTHVLLLLLIIIIIGATGTVSKSFRKYVSNIPGKHEVKELQKTAILGTAHTPREVLM